jgi:hypothetical protein
MYAKQEQWFWSFRTRKIMDLIFNLFCSFSMNAKYCRLLEEDIQLIEDLRYLLDKLLSRTSDQLIRLTQVWFGAVLQMIQPLWLLGFGVLFLDQVPEL